VRWAIRSVRIATWTSVNPCPSRELVVLDDLLLLSHNVLFAYESDVSSQVANVTTHIVSVADRISILAVPR